MKRKKLTEKYSFNKLFYATNQSIIDKMVRNPRKRAFDTFDDKVIVGGHFQKIDRFLLLFVHRTEVREICGEFTYTAYFKEMRGVVYFIKESISKKTNPEMKISGTEILTRILK